MSSDNLLEVNLHMETDNGAAPKKGDIRQAFLAQYGAAYSKGVKVTAADSDFQFFVDTQRQRLAKKDLYMDYDFLPRGRNAGGRDYSNRWCDEHYFAKMNGGTCTFRRILKKGNKVISLKKLPAQVPIIITDVLENSHVENDIYVCPGCGHPAPIRELTEGCTSCSAKFRMDELYPKVSNFNIVRDYSMTGKEMAPKFLIPAVIGFAAGIILIPIIGILVFLLTVNGHETGGMMLGEAFAQLIFAAPFYGLLAGGAGIFLRLVIDAVKAAPLLQTFKSHKYFEEEMKKHGQEFMPHYFMGKTVARLKTVIFSEDPSVLPFYTGSSLPEGSEDVVDIIFRGAMDFKNVQVADNVARVDVDVYTEVLSEKHGRARNKNRIYHLKMAKNITRKTGLDFSIRKLVCDSCGASFDAYKNKFCPYCGSEYRMLDSDWVIESVT